MKLSYQKFEGKIHGTLMTMWLDKRGMNTDDQSHVFLPPTGYVIYNFDYPVCMGFLVKCDNKTAIHTDFISDISIEKNQRNAAAEFLRDILAREAERCGIRFVTAYTSIPEHADRLVKKLGFTKIGEGMTQVGKFIWP